MHLKNHKKTYYQIRVELFWGMILCTLLLSAVGIHTGYQLRKQEPEDPVKEEPQLRVEVIYDDWVSKLEDPSRCLLCQEILRQEAVEETVQDTMGVLLLHDWTVLNLTLRNTGSTEENREHASDSGIRYGYSSGIAWLSGGDPDRGMAEISLTLPEHCTVDKEHLQQNLCQPCLEQVADTLRFWKGEQEEKEALPLCLLDFQTAELYPAQDWYRGYFIRDYWVELDLEEHELSIKTYYLPPAAGQTSG